jgi:N6-adenosine-specific RNA methylase IME4
MADLFSESSTIAAPPRAGEYATCMADPPWLERGGGQIKRGADRHYPLMKTRDICALPVGDWLAPDAHLYLWVTNNFLPDGLQVMAAWGFRFVTKIDWFKSGDSNDEIGEHNIDAADRDLQIGLGQYFRGCTESCLFGVRGNVPYRTRPDGKRAQGRTGFHAPREEHSRKPEKMRRMVELVSPGPYLELFARRPADGWDVWGNEAT